MTPIRPLLLLAGLFASRSAIAMQPASRAARSWSADPGAIATSSGPPLAGVTDRGDGAVAFVLVSGIVGGVATFRQVEDRLVARGQRVLVIDPYLLSIDSADVTFAALARRVSRVLRQLGVRDARMVGHERGAGVLLRVAATCADCVSALYFLDTGALASGSSPILSASLRLVPIIARAPGGREILRRHLVRGLRENSGRAEWLDAPTARAYVEPLLDHIDGATALAIRVARCREPESVDGVVARIRVPVTVILGDAPHDAGPGPEELTALTPLGPLLRVEHLAGVGHFPQEEAPDDVVRVLSGPFLPAVASGGGAR